MYVELRLGSGPSQYKEGVWERGPSTPKVRWRNDRISRYSFSIHRCRNLGDASTASRRSKPAASDRGCESRRVKHKPGVDRQSSRRAPRNPTGSATRDEAVEWRTRQSGDVASPHWLPRGHRRAAIGRRGS